MRVLFAAVCMGLIMVTVATLVVIDVIIKLLPLIVVALVAVVALRLVHRRWHTAAGSPTRPSVACGVPNAAAMFCPSHPHNFNIPCRAGAVIHWRPTCYTACAQPHPIVIDAGALDVQVISEDNHRG
ncbi:hypothetical protein ACQ86B_28540 (plasmid) [Mycolicibacterium aichiense]|uniref:hypothetical protein n=1 Tax=Mycolicibacterium aichiense TaxID=1799 RepID=UPI003D666903